MDQKNKFNRHRDQNIVGNKINLLPNVIREVRQFSFQSAAAGALLNKQNSAGKYIAAICAGM